MEAYADGTRLFAYRVLKRRLTCEELRRAQAETRDLVPAMGAPEHAATRRLTQQVADELRAERLRRCRADAKR